jgi:hypothetical protein
MYMLKAAFMALTFFLRGLGVGHYGRRGAGLPAGTVPYAQVLAHRDAALVVSLEARTGEALYALVVAVAYILVDLYPARGPARLAPGLARKFEHAGMPRYDHLEAWLV